MEVVKVLFTSFRRVFLLRFLLDNDYCLWYCCGYQKGGRYYETRIIRQRKHLAEVRWSLDRNSDEARKPLKESMKNWLRVYKFPEVEHTTYDRYECTAEHQIYPYIGNKLVGDVTPADIKKLLTKHMNKGYAFTTSKKAYSLLKMFFKQLYQEGEACVSTVCGIFLNAQHRIEGRGVVRHHQQ